MDDSGFKDLGDRLISEAKDLDPADALERVRDWASDNPMMAVGIAFAAGIVVGAAVTAAVNEEEEEEARLVSDVVRETSNRLLDKVKETSAHVVSDARGHLASFQKPEPATESNDSGSMADTIVATIMSLVSRKVGEWARNR